MGEIMALERQHWPELYRLMVARRFPAVPPKFAEAEPMFGAAKLFGLLDGSELKAGFVFGAPDEGIAHFDVVCSQQTQGLWATREVLRRLFALAFGELGLRCVWVQPHGKRALRAALQAGFLAVTPLDGLAPVLAMTPHLLPPKFKLKEEKNDGKFV